jgi:hypothetical protein
MIMLGLMWQSQMVTISLLLQTAKPQYQWAVDRCFDTQGRSLSISGLVGPAPHDPTATGAAVSVHLPSYFYLSRKTASDDGKFTATRLLF